MRTDLNRPYAGTAVVIFWAAVARTFLHRRDIAEF